VLAAFFLVIVSYGIGFLGADTYSYVAFGGVICAAVGLMIHRPTVMWPWLAMLGVGVLWTLSGALADHFEVTGDLSAGRSLVPDALALPGYLLFGAALQGWYRSRRGRHNSDTLLDAIMLAAGSSLVMHEVLISPALTREGAWFMAQLSVAAYPTLALCLMVVAARLAFSGGHRSVAFHLVLAGTISLLIGDFVYALGEIGTFQAPTAVLEIPYLLIPTCLGAAALHPSVRGLGVSAHRPVSQLGPGRLAAVGGALFAPILVMASPDANPDNRVAIVLSCVLALAAIIRISTAIRSQAASEALLYQQATHDDLTGLPGRNLLIQHTADLLTARPDDPLVLLFLDLDQFKLINDSMGHAAGDSLLVQAADRISTSVRQEDLVGRISGDEFIVVSAGLDTSEAHALADRIQTALRDPFQLPEGEVFVSVSIGMAISEPGHEVPAAVLLQQADTAMYHSKAAGRDSWTRFDVSMQDRVATQMEMERALRHALDQRQLTVAFQPIVSTPGAQVRGFEALARWQTPTRMISPAEFIPVAEDCGLIVPLGAFVLDEACRQLAWWRKNLPGATDWYVSVNLSPRQMRAGDIVDLVAEALDRHSLPGEALWLEITESVMIEESLATSSVMTGLRGLGVRLAVDDFGTGFSSLSYLKRFPVSRVKIDRSFVAGLGTDESDTSLVAAVVAMAFALGLEPVAEGVETQDQAARLIELGCTQMQGFLFGRPVPATDVAELFGPSTSDVPRDLGARQRRCTMSHKA
jgi:diguanylate cyclase (GGDEF)-like protein